MRFIASLETFDDATCLGWVHELPGCAVRTRHRTEIERALAAEIRRFLTEAGEPVPNRIELAIACETASPGAGPESTSALIAPDLAPLDSIALSHVVHRLALSRERLLARLDAAARLPGEDAAAVREEAYHVGIVELLLAARTFDPETDQGVRDLLAWSRDVVTGRLSDACSSDDVAPRVHDRGAEAWTSSKVARRLVWHERLHVSEPTRGR